MKNMRLTDAEIDELLVSYRNRRVELSAELAKVKKKLKRAKSEKARRTA